MLLTHTSGLGPLLKNASAFVLSRECLGTLHILNFWLTNVPRLIM